MLTSAIALAVVAGSAAASGSTGGFSATQLADSYVAAVAPGTAGRSAGGSELPGLPRKGGGGRRLLTGFGDLYLSGTDDAIRQQLMNDAVGMNAKVVRLYVRWRSVAPSSPTAAFDATNPADPEYNWARIDEAVQDASSRGLSPILLTISAPAWAEGENRPADALPGTWMPNPQDVADFGTAIASRYSGTFQSLPRVRDHMLWNEPNLPTNLTPQWDASGTVPVVASHYRKMLNAFYEAVHGVDPSNRVVTGGTAPYGSPPGPGAVQVAPLLFWRSVMCVAGLKRPHATKCPQKPKFDVLSHHPINTSGGPTDGAINPDDISTADLHNLVDVLRAAESGKNLGTPGKHPVWASEVWWESNPPDPFEGNPSLAKQAKWYAQALYVLWKQGASMVLFYQVRDEPFQGPPGRGSGSSFDTGVFFSDGRQKPSAQAVRFPFVADRISKKEVVLWGIAPSSGRLAVKGIGGGSKRITTLKVKAAKIFTETVELRGRQKLVASVAGARSLEYPVVR